MSDKEDEPEVDLATLILNHMMEKMSDGKKRALAGWIEDKVFPVYELATGESVGSNKDARDMLAEKLEHDLASVTWVMQPFAKSDDEDLEFAEGDEEFVEDEESFDEQEFIIKRVFAQSAKDGLYELVVIVTPVQDRTVYKEMSLAMFLLAFKPKDGMVLRYFDA